MVMYIPLTDIAYVLVTQAMSPMVDLAVNHEVSVG